MDITEAIDIVTTDVNELYTMNHREAIEHTRNTVDPGLGLDESGDPIVLAAYRQVLAATPEAIEQGLDELEVHCAEHGVVQIISEFTSSGFTGAPIYVANLSCGCQLVDASADNEDAAR